MCDVKQSMAKSTMTKTNYRFKQLVPINLTESRLLLLNEIQTSKNAESYELISDLTFISVRFVLSRSINKKDRTVTNKLIDTLNFIFKLTSHGVTVKKIVRVSKRQR